MNEQFLSQLAPSLPWASVQFRQGRITSAQVKELGQIAVRQNPDLLSFDVPDRGGYEVVLDTVLGDLFDHGLELRVEHQSFSLSRPIDLGLESGDFPLVADASYVMELKASSQRDLARRLTIAICLLDGFRFDQFLDWWVESIKEMAFDDDEEEELEEGEQTHAQIRVADLEAIKVGGRMFRKFSSILFKQKLSGSGNSFLARFQKEIEEWNPAPSSTEEAWKNWIADVLCWHGEFAGSLDEMPEDEDRSGVCWSELVGFGWANDTFWEEYDGMINSQYEGDGIAAPGHIEVTSENVLFSGETSARHMEAFGGLCQLIHRFNSLKEN